MVKAAVVGVALLAVGLIAGFRLGVWSVERDVLPPVVPVRVSEAGLGFQARLDTGATVSSINAHDIVVIGGGQRPAASDVGKSVRFVVINDAGEQRELTARVEQVRGVRMAGCREVRYHVFLTVEHRGRALRILTNLNDRSQAGDKLLLGRNWLHHGFAVGPVEDAEI